MYNLFLIVLNINPKGNGWPAIIYTDECMDEEIIIVNMIFHLQEFNLSDFSSSVMPCKFNVNLF